MRTLARADPSVLDAGSRGNLALGLMQDKNASHTLLSGESCEAFIAAEEMRRGTPYCLSYST